VIIDEEKDIMHYGVLRRSGRYPWGSGGVEDKNSKHFLDYVTGFRKEGLNDKEIARGLGISVSELRASYTVARNEQKREQQAQAQRLRDKGNSPAAIARRMGLPDSTVRNLLKPGEQEKTTSLANTAQMLKDKVDEKWLVDVGEGVETQLNISKERLNAAITKLKQEWGYVVHPVKIPMATAPHDLTVKVLAPPGTTWGEVNKNKHQIKQLNTYSPDGGNKWTKEHPAISVNPKRVGIKYKEDGGDKQDGIILVRRNSPDLSLGASRYAQVRIKVGNDHYIKGMAMYSDNMPDGVDLLFHTSKSDTGNKLDALKPISDDPDLPFGAVTKPLLANAGTDKEKNISAMNIVNEEGDWSRWSQSLSAQFLAKQDPSLAKKQLTITTDRRRKELDEILALTNPVIKKKLLFNFSQSADTASVNLKAAAMSQNQRWHAILPVTSMKPGEVYAPNYNNGDRVALVRYPHGGTFEIPELTVNNRNPEARGLIGNSADAIGIHHSVAERLSGADFDGDTVIVIPNRSGSVKSTPALKELEGFNPRVEYKEYPGMVPITEARKQQEMGKVSNLITDMTIKGAPPEHIARAIKHSMVVIDSFNHNLDYKRSELQNGIRQLKDEYQGHTTAKGRKSTGASTLLSRAGAREMVPDRKNRLAGEGGPVDLATGKKMYVPTGKTYRSGKPVMIRSTKMAEADDAHTLSSGTPVENIYAEYANETKAMANEARRAILTTPSLKMSPSAKTAYASEVASLNSKLALAKENRPLERQAQIFADAEIQAKRDSNPQLDEASLKKIKTQAINTARARTGADKKKRTVEITPQEWDAIQAGAISNHMLEEILTNTDLEQLRQYATPHRKVLMTTTNQEKARQLIALGYSRAEIATRLGVSVTTLNTALKGGD
jgi:DNA-binding CsgD family transcriptional regulator/transposase